MAKMNAWLIALGLVLYSIGFFLGIGITFIGVIPIFGDVANIAGGLVEEFFQFIGLMILVFAGRA